VKINLSVQAGLLITVGVGLGYAMAMRDAEGITDRLDRMEVKLDDILDYVKLREVIESGEPEVEDAEVVQEETPEGEKVT
jgi:hypothetical protein